MVAAATSKPLPAVQSLSSKESDVFLFIFIIYNGKQCMHSLTHSLSSCTYIYGICSQSCCC